MAGFSFRQPEPIAARWRRTIPATKVRVRDDSGSAARWKGIEALVKVKPVLVDRLTYQGFSSLSSDTLRSDHSVTDESYQAESG